MSNKLTKHEAERLIAALDDLGDDDVHLERLRTAAATALARLVGRQAPWSELVEAAAAIAGWSKDRVQLLCREENDETGDVIFAMYELITELSETRSL